MTVRAVAVVVPAHDERALLPGCLAALAVAAHHPALDGIPVRLVPVLDACTDGSTAPGAVRITARNVGIARATGCAVALRDCPPEQLWLATTDADSRVPADWLAVQLRLHRAGADAVAGTVQVADWSGQPARVRRRFASTYGQPGEDHRHVHGANLGLSATAYLAAGGVPALPVGEDQALADALRATGHRVVATGRIPVRTSARRTGRATGGFADHLRALGAA